MASLFRTLVLGFVVMLPTALAAAVDRLGIHPGMGIAEIRQILQDRCDDLYGDPYVTCTRGTTIITATLSPKGRAYYIARWEVSPLPREKYAAEVAQELGFTGPGEECSDDGEEMRCWYADDGTRLMAAETDTSEGAPKSRYTIFLMNERIKDEDAQ